MFYQNLSPDGTECYGPLTVTLIGYKVMEERSKFTLYKILVRRAPDETWVIYRRYTEFSQLNDKLKELFPWLNVGLPPKRWFKNFNAEFLEERQLALQTFLHNLVSHRHVTNSEAVKEFLCLNDPPAASDGSEESMPFTEKHEETSCGLQKELMDKKREIGPLRNTLEDRALQISKPGRTVNGTYMTQEELNGQAAVNHWIESNSDANGDFLREQEYNEVERDNLRRHKERSELQFIRSHGACWCGSAIDSPYTNIQTRAPEDNL